MRMGFAIHTSDYLLGPIYHLPPASMLSSATITLALLLTCVHGAPPQPDNNILPPEAFSPLVAQKVLATAQRIQNPPRYPQWTDRDAGAWQFFSPDTWTTGFFPSTLYALNERKTLCKSRGSDATLINTDWLSLGQTWSAAEVPLETKTGVGHDVGFLSFPFIEELKLRKDNQTAINAVNKFATELAARYSPIVGCTRSWDAADPTDFQVIIDNMMNLEVLFVSYEYTKNETLRDIAISHANKTMVNHLRPDGSSYHVVDYNSTTGQVFRQRTSQGFSDSSTWSRGQAWGIYGFANMYKRTQISEYLKTARHMADYFLDNMPQDGIVPWDFNAPTTPPRPADSSAAMIATNGLLLLAQQELKLAPPNMANYYHWLNSASSLINKMTELAWRPSWQSLLANGTVNNPAQNNLTGIVYGDYYFILAANEMVRMGAISC